MRGIGCSISRKKQFFLDSLSNALPPFLGKLNAPGSALNDPDHAPDNDTRDKHTDGHDNGPVGRLGRPGGPALRDPGGGQRRA